VLLDAFQLELYERLASSSDLKLAAIAAKSLKETRYHWRYSAAWLVRLGDGTVLSHERASAALKRLWPLTTELFSEDDIERGMAQAGIAPKLSEVKAAWNLRIDETLVQARLERPNDVRYCWFGKQGTHSEHLGYLLSDMQYLQRTYPGAKW
jgi:ring-1,2-phenylacetyl-CoA epoxidase subunit PaaC